MNGDMAWTRRDQGYSPPPADLDRPSIARVYDAVLGGKNNYPIDRIVAEQLVAAFPDGGEGAWVNRALLGRAVRYMAGQGIDQFLDLGSGLPTVQNTHEMAHSVKPSARVVYVDNDPIVLAHGEALLAADRNTRVVTADLRDPDKIQTNPEISTFLELDRPIGLILNAVIHHIPDDGHPDALVNAYKAMLAPGSYLLLTHFCTSSRETRALESVMIAALGTGKPRSLGEIASFFDGLELVEPGVVYLPYWHPDTPVEGPLDIGGLLYAGGLGRKPDYRTGHGAD
jgi:hypothetical protein